MKCACEENDAGVVTNLCGAHQAAFRSLQKPPVNLEAIKDDLQVILNTAGDLDAGMVQGSNRIRGNIGGPVTRACARISKELSIG